MSISLAVACALTAGLVVSASAGKQRATLALVKENPVVVVGRGFLRGERVTLRTAINGQRFTRTVTANRYGRFTRQVADVDAECWPFTISASGMRGSHAVTRKINIPPPCGVPIQP